MTPGQRVRIRAANPRNVRDGQVGTVVSVSPDNPEAKDARGRRDGRDNRLVWVAFEGSGSGPYGGAVGRACFWVEEVEAL